MHCEYRRRLGSICRGAAMAAVVLTISACSGSNFVRPNADGFVLGKTSSQQVLKQMGKPYRVGSVTRNGQKLQTVNYAYASFGGGALHSGVTPARSQGFYFQNGTLVGTDFTSSFKSDGTDFDARKVSQLVKGQSTREDVIKLLGPADGYYIAPMITDATGSGLVYLYAQSTGSAFNMHTLTKYLIVTCDAAGTVTDVQYSEGTR